eukprot:6923636-Alexandrium_andersonii.AAC.1
MSELKLTEAGKLLGGQHPWIKNKLSMRLEFMHLEQNYQELYEKSWHTRTEETIKPIAADPPTALGDGEDPNNEAGQKEKDPKASKGKKPSRKDPKEQKEPKDKGGDTMQKNLAALKSLKAEM